MLTAHDYPDEPASRVNWSTYRQATDTRPAQVFVELRVDRDLNPANLARQRAAEERLVGGTDQVCGSIDNVATRHLQELTGTSARVAEDGYAVTIEMQLPQSQEGPVNGVLSTLSADQESVLPELTRSLEAALPRQERHHTESLARMVAKEIPPMEDVIRSSDRVTLAEIIDHHERRMGTEIATLPASVRLTGLSFPQHPGAALHNPQNNVPASTTAAHSHRISPDLER